MRNVGLDLHKVNSQICEVDEEGRVVREVRIATGRDAADASVATIFGRMQMTGMAVSCVSNDFTPLGAGDLAGHAILIEP